MLVGTDHEVVASQRVGAVQTPGGSGALRVLAGLVLRADPAARLWVPDPTWANHVPLLGAAGLDLAPYPHYDQATHSLVFDRLVAALEEVGPDDLVLFHGCCHNPCGADLSPAQWDAVADVADTDINDHTGFLTTTQGAAITVRMATLGADGPTGGFFGEDGPVPW